MFDTVIFAVDGPDSEAALPTAQELADRFLSRIVIVHVSELVTGRANLPYRGDEARIRARLHEIVDELRDAGVDATLEMHSVVGGRAAKIIADVAERHEAGLIVVAARGHSPVLGLLNGSITQRLLHTAPCPVLAVPMRGKAALNLPAAPAAA